jgi:hypothetical protein
MSLHTPRPFPRLPRRIILVLAAAALPASLALAAPLEPLNSHVDASVSGFARVISNPKYPADSSYLASTQSDRFVNTDLRLAQGIEVGHTPTFDHSAKASSVAGAEFEQVAPNELVLTLSYKALGELVRGQTAGFQQSDFGAHSRLSFYGQFRISGDRFPPPYPPATIHYALEHYGTMWNLNGAKGYSNAEVHITAPGSPGLHYVNKLTTPALSSPDFQDMELTATRNYSTQGSLTSYTGALITISALIDNDVAGLLFANNASTKVAGANLFDSGIRLHMTVMPEPATAVLLVSAGLLALRRRATR